MRRDLDQLHADAWKLKRELDGVIGLVRYASTCLDRSDTEGAKQAIADALRRMEAES
jgi:hypothetical protein